MAGASLAVRMPGGNFVDVGFAPIVAAMSLGGPIVARLGRALGATQSRELRGKVPWFGVLANHAAIAGPAVASAFLLDLAPFRSNLAIDFLSTFAAACLFFTLNILITAQLVSARDGEPVWQIA